MKNLNKAAMFGLDARIALAIFGALSVISGAALYSAIKESKITALSTEINEIEKAVAQYYLDTGIYPNLNPISPIYNLDANNLLTKPSAVNNWQGPYLSLAINAGELLISSVDSNITYGIGYRKSGTWGGQASSDMVCKKSYTTCHIWIGVDGMDLSTIKEFERRLDGTKTPPSTDYSNNINYNGSWMHKMTSIPFPPGNAQTP